MKYLAVILVGLLAWLASGAAAATPVATITPDSGLKSGETVTLHASGLPPDQPIEVVECQGTVTRPPRDNTVCDGATADTTGYSDRSGDYLNSPTAKNGTSGYEVDFLPSVHETVSNIKCTATVSCVLYVGVDFEDFRQPKTFVALNWRGAGGGGSSFPYVAVAIAVVVLAIGALVWLRRRQSGAAATKR